MPTPPTIIAFAASNSNKSINRRLITHAVQVLKESFALPLNIEILDINDFEMPLFSPERELTGIPQLAHDFYAKIGAADGVVISFAEHNGTYTAAFKNLFDWTSRINIKVFQGNPTLLMATSMGARGGQNVLTAALGGFPHFGANITSSFSFGPFSEHFDTASNRLTTPALMSELHDAITAFAVTLPVATWT